MTNPEHATLAALIGTPTPWAHALMRAIGAVGDRDWRAAVAPLVARHWPAAHGSRAAWKLHFLTTRTYAAGVYTTLLFSPRRPIVLAPVIALGRLPGARAEHLARLARLALPALGRVAMRDACRRITLVGAFVAAIDHAFDYGLGHLAPSDRGRILHALMHGESPPDDPLLRLVRALQLAMEAGLRGPARARYAAAIARCHDWVDAEVQACGGVADPAGEGHRRAGVEGVIDGLLFPVADLVGDDARRWMYGASLFIQIMDDWLDRAADAAAGRPTPAVTGAWTFAEVARHWHASHAGVAAVATRAGLGSPALIALGQETYRAAIHDVMRAMVEGHAD